MVEKHGNFFKNLILTRRATSIAIFFVQADVNDKCARRYISFLPFLLNIFNALIARSFSTKFCLKNMNLKSVFINKSYLVYFI